MKHLFILLVMAAFIFGCEKKDDVKPINGQVQTGLAFDKFDISDPGVSFGRIGNPGDRYAFDQIISDDFASFSVIDYETVMSVPIETFASGLTNQGLIDFRFTAEIGREYNFYIPASAPLPANNYDDALIFKQLNTWDTWTGNATVAPAISVMTDQALVVIDHGTIPSENWNARWTAVGIDMTVTDQLIDVAPGVGYEELEVAYICLAGTDAPWDMMGGASPSVSIKIIGPDLVERTCNLGIPEKGKAYIIKCMDLAGIGLDFDYEDLFGDAPVLITPGG